MKKYYVSSIHTSYEDNYQNGEGAFCTEWKQDRIVKAENLENALQFYFNNEIYSNFNLKNLDIYENKLQTSILVDVNNCEASEYELEKWRKDELTLYVQYISISVEIMQSVDIEHELSIQPV